MTVLLREHLEASLSVQNWKYFPRPTSTMVVLPHLKVEDGRRRGWSSWQSSQGSRICLRAVDLYALGEATHHGLELCNPLIHSETGDAGVTALSC